MRKAETRNVCVIAWDNEPERAISDPMVSGLPKCRYQLASTSGIMKELGPILARKAKMALKLKCPPPIVYNLEEGRLV